MDRRATAIKVNAKDLPAHLPHTNEASVKRLIYFAILVSRLF
jgi:hypothetical protein